jgi:hypothetical protein
MTAKAWAVAAAARRDLAPGFLHVLNFALAHSAYRFDNPPFRD